NALGNPGPCVAATPCNCPALTRASSSAFLATGIRFRKCSRAANSGTTPPYSACVSTCDETMFDKTRPSCTTAALVSSQEVSKAKSIAEFYQPGSFQHWRLTVQAQAPPSPSLPRLFGLLRAPSRAPAPVA